MIDHVGIAVANLERASAFYAAALAPLGYERVVERDGQVAFGREGRARLWLSQGINTTRPVHVAVAARSREDVEAFHAAAIAAGAYDDVSPSELHDGAGPYYGAAVRDEEDRKIEAVFRG